MQGRRTEQAKRHIPNKGDKMEAKHYERSTRRTVRTRQHPDAELAQALHTRGDLTIVPPMQGELWKGIVDGTEVRVSERWKPSRRARTYHTRAQKERLVQKAVVQPKRTDVQLMATMRTDHDYTTH